MSSSQRLSGPPGSLLRVSITSADRRLDVGVPAATPLAELLPGFVRGLGELDSSLVHGGYRLTRADGSTLDPNTSLRGQGVNDGERLALITGANDLAPRIYDDVVEAVGDAVESQHRAWTATDSAQTALAASSAFLVVSAILLLGAPSPMFGVLISSVAAILVLGLAAVLGRIGQGKAGRALATTATVFGVVAGYLAASHRGTILGWPMALGALGAVIVAGLGLLVVSEKREICVAPLGAGTVLGIAGVFIGAFNLDPVAVLALTMALVVTVGNGIPWLAVSSSRIKVVSALSDAEIYADQSPIDGDEIIEQYNASQQFLVALRAAVSVIALICAIPVATSGISGTLLCTLSFLGMMVGSRQTHARADVLTVMGTGVVGLVMTGLTAVGVHPEWRIALIVVLGVTAAVTVAVAMLSDKPHLGLGRVADAVDLTALALLLPFGVITAGLV